MKPKAYEDDKANIPSRLTRLETGLESLQQDVQSLAKSVGELVRREGRPNYTAWGIALSAIAVIGAIAATAVFGPITSLDRISFERTNTSIRDRERLADRLDQAIRNEQVRNNDFGERLGKVEAMYDLFVAGKLRME